MFKNLVIWAAKKYAPELIVECVIYVGEWMAAKTDTTWDDQKVMELKKNKLKAIEAVKNW
jgi:hypothetical protein